MKPLLGKMENMRKHNNVYGVFWYLPGLGDFRYLSEFCDEQPHYVHDKHNVYLKSQNFKKSIFSLI